MFSVKGLTIQRSVNTAASRKKTHIWSDLNIITQPVFENAQHDCKACQLRLRWNTGVVLSQVLRLGYKLMCVADEQH